MYKIMSLEKLLVICLLSKKFCLVIIGTSSHEKLKNMPSWRQFDNCLKTFV